MKQLANQIKQVVLIILVFSLSLSSYAQEWSTNFEAAKKTAVEKNRKIILVFQGTDWCAPCMKLEREVWSQEVFKAHAAKNYVMVQADFPRRKQNKLPEELAAQNGKLFETYNKQGYFPHVVVFNPQGKVVGQTGYKGIGAEEYIKLLDSF